MPSFVAFEPLSCPFLNLGNKCQISCSETHSILSRFVIGFAIKGIARIYDIALHIIAGLGKSMICTAMAAHSILAKLWNSTANCQKIRKESFVHFSLSGLYVLDIFVSYRNVTNNYPKNLIKKIEAFFYDYLKEPCAITQAIQRKPEENIAPLLSREQSDIPEGRTELFDTEYHKYLKKYPDEETAKKHTEHYVKNHIKFFEEIYSERKKKQSSVEKAEIYAKDCIRIICAVLPKYLRNYTQEEAEKHAVDFAKTYVNQYLKALKENCKNMELTKAKKEAEQYAQKYAEKQMTEKKLKNNRVSSQN